MQENENLMQQALQTKAYRGAPDIGLLGAGGATISYTSNVTPASYSNAAAVLSNS